MSGLHLLCLSAWNEAANLSLFCDYLAIIKPLQANKQVTERQVQKIVTSRAPILYVYHIS